MGGQESVGCGGVRTEGEKEEVLGGRRSPSSLSLLNNKANMNAFLAHSLSLSSNALKATLASGQHPEERVSESSRDRGDDRRAE